MIKKQTCFLRRFSTQVEVKGSAQKGKGGYFDKDGKFDREAF